MKRIFNWLGGKEEEEVIEILASLPPLLLPEEEGEVFLCYYHEIYMNGEDEEMFERDKALGNLPT